MDNLLCNFDCGFFACGIVFMILAIKSWFSSRRTVNQSMGKVWRYA